MRLILTEHLTYMMNFIVLLVKGKYKLKAGTKVKSKVNRKWYASEYINHTYVSLVNTGEPKVVPTNLGAVHKVRHARGEGWGLRRCASL